MFADWEGNLTQSISSPKLTLEHSSNTRILGQVVGIQEVDRGESFTLSVMAFDAPDDNWTIVSAIAPHSISISGSAVDQNVIEIIGIL